MIPSKITRAFPFQGGFALVVTLSLMILLTVIAVGLLTLSSVSLRSSSQGQAASTARANARLALMMAIGELQKEMGPDSRISAPHDAGNTAPGGQPHWTAVYDAWVSPPGAAETPQSRAPKFRGWLASGANSATGGPVGTMDKVLLLGANSLGGTATADDEIRVPMHEVSTGQQRGRLAWWTADDAAKAKVNAGPDATTTLASAAPNPLFDTQSPANVGHRAFPKLEQFDWKEGQRAKTISTAQINLAAGLVGQAGVGNISHDLTVSSAGVMTDVRQGRLKRDLSNLLSRDVKEIENKPLYLANGRMNRFAITKDGAISNASDLPSDTTSNRWGINLEEMYLFHNIHREMDWSGGKPSLTMKSTGQEIFKDRYYIYRQPMFDAVQFILSLRAVPDKAVAGEPRYKMEPMLDGMAALSNPNDIPLVWPPGLTLYLQLNRIPYLMRWKIQNKEGMVYPNNKESEAPFFKTFRGFVGGGAKAANPAGGFKLEPGESAAFGSSTAIGQDMDIMRGFAPSGGVSFTEWNINATGLKADDKIDFDLVFNETGDRNQIFASYGAWVKKTGGTQWQPEGDVLTGVDRSLPLVQKLLPSPIRPPQVLPVSAFLPDPTDPQRKPKPIMMLNFLRNVEQSSPSPQNDAFPSRPFQLNEPAAHQHWVIPNKNEESRRHFNQTLITTEAMNYRFRTLAAGAGGRNVYHGGGRQPGLLGGSFNVIKRRLPLAPPLSLGAFENAIATGFTQRFDSIRNEPSASAGPTAVGLTGFGLNDDGTRIAKAVGNSWSLPFMASDKVNVGRATDHSWFVNTALWDQWFLSGIVDGRGAGSSPWMSDSRSPRAQFRDLAEGTGSLRNKRYLFYRSKTSDQALDDLFDGENFKPAALNKLAKYLLIDGAFNVNSTSVAAWKALLTSVRKQKLVTGAGTLQDADHPFGTLGYAVNPANAGTSEGDWNGFLDLTAAQMDDLAAAVVGEIKSRGPFLNLADFVNRRPDSSDAAQRALGALQAAIDKSGINKRFTASGRELTSDDLDPLDGKNTVAAEPNPARAIGAAGYLSQAGLLTAIGSQITVRADTFTIRAYGDARDPTGTKIIAKAWCEAVIQRVPDYVDPTDAPEAQDGWPQAANKLAPVNALFGRRLTIQSFRWLNSNEI